MNVLFKTLKYFQWSKLSKELLFFLGFVFVSIALTYPWLLYFDRSVYGYGHPFYVIWRFWWNSFSATREINPDFTQFIGAPVGSSVISLVDPVIPFLLGNLLTRLTHSPVFAYNFLVFLSLPLSGYFSFLLFRHLTGKKLISFFFALLYAFSPYHLAHLGQFSLASIQLFPLVILAFVKIREKPTLKSSVFLGLVVALSFLTDLYYGYFSLLLLLFLLFFDLLINSGKDRRLWTSIKALPYYLLSGIIAVLLVLPFLYPLLLTRLINIDLGLPLTPGLDDLIVHTARPWDYFLPVLTHPWLGSVTARLKDLIESSRGSYWFYLPHTTEAGIFLGFTISFLALGAAVYYCFRRRKDPTLFWVPVFFATALSLFFISLPPDIYLGKNNEHHIILLSYRLHQLFPMFRAYVRLGILVLLLFLSLAVWLTGQVLDCWSLRTRRIFILLIFVIIPFEFLNNLSGSLYIFDRTPSVYQWLAKQPDNFIIAELPVDGFLGNCPGCLIFQSEHTKYLFGPPELIYYDYYESSRKDDQNYIPFQGIPLSFNEEAYRTMKNSGVKYLVVHTLTLFRHPNQPFLPITFNSAWFFEYFKPIQTFSDGIIYELVQ